MSPKTPCLLDEPFLRKVRTMLLRTRGAPLAGAAGGIPGPSKGGNVEFREHRAYAPGDELRYVDWNAYARTGHLHVKEFAREQDRLVLLRVDRSASMSIGRPPKSDTALRLAAAIGTAALASGCRVRAATFAEGAAREGAEHAGAHGEANLLREMASAPGTAGRTGLGASLRPFLEPGAPRGEVLLFTDLLDPVDPRKEFSALVERGNDLTVVATWAAEDLHVGDGGVARLRDAETGEERLVVIGPGEREAYEAAQRAFEEDWTAFLTRHGARLIPVRTDTPLETIVFEEMQRHGLLAGP